jgi:hypothetical protein
MAFDSRHVYASGNVPEKNLLCVRADGQGDVSGTHVVWSTNQLITYVPSLLLVNDYLFAVNDSGVAWCRDANTGQIIWKHRLGGKFFASPLLACGNIYATSEAGITYVFRAGPKFELIAENDIGEICMATPAVAGGKVYLRSLMHLYCIGNAAE